MLFYFDHEMKLLQEPVLREEELYMISSWIAKEIVIGSKFQARRALGGGLI